MLKEIHWINKSCLLLSLLFVFFVGCTNQTSMKEEASVLRNSKDLDNKDGMPIILEGVYTLHHPFPAQKGKSDETIVKIKLEGGEEVFLEPYWSENSRRSEDEIHLFKDKKVQVKGIFHMEQPKQPGAPDYASLFIGSCIFPVESIELKVRKR